MCLIRLSLSHLEETAYYNTITQIKPRKNHGFPTEKSTTYHLHISPPQLLQRLFPLPPRNLLRQTNSLEKEFNKANQGLESLNLTSRPSSFIQHSPQSQSIAYSLQPHKISSRLVESPEEMHYIQWTYIQWTIFRASIHTEKTLHSIF